MKNLQKIADSLAYCQSESAKRESLSRAFQMFSRETARLESAYHTLNENFKQLTHQLQDVNSQLHAKVAELDITTEYLKTILDNVVQGILFIDRQGFITTYNRAAENILGKATEEVLFTKFWQHFADDTFGFSMEHAIENQQAPTCFSVHYTTPHNLHSELEVTTSFVDKNSANKYSLATSIVTTPTHGLIVTLRDITEVHHLQTLASHADRMKELGKMAAHVAHEIRNPLGGIKGFAALLKRDLADHPSLQQMADHIVEGTDHLGKLVNQILLYARPIQLHIEPANIIAALEEIRQLVLADASLAQQGVDISIDAPFTELTVPIDIASFKSALLNLIVNAIQAMPQGGKIVLGVRKQYGRIIISIADNGIGISEENLPKLFSPFFTTKPDGTGLGLTEVQKVVQAHGGTIEVVSKEGQGTTFCIKLPTKQRSP